MSPNARKQISYLAGALILVLGATLAANAEQGVLRSTGRATDVGAETVVPMQTGPSTFGTTSIITYTVPAFAFGALDDSTQASTGPYNRYSPTGQEVEAPVFLPSGALISSIELQGCDSDASAQVVFILFTATTSGSYVALSPLGGTGATPGCGFFPLALTTPHTVDNLNNTYYVAVRSGTTSATSYTAVRVSYNLQVSPAPGTATFTDVPTTHPQFRFVEALVAAGITAGCGGGNYCPDAALTRGQMAVYLSVALGLHWPN